ncbi:MAG: hypothetical protein IJ390_08930 [Lachnospiraceae bacterium]|nr:hypothetical protein [Lachnospiraceae bacterium]
MTRTINGKVLKTAEVPGKRNLYIIEKDRVIDFKEKENGDSVEIKFYPKEGQYGIYAEEYLPETAVKTGRKKADITALIVDEDNNIGEAVVADVKSDVGGEDVIAHLCEQWQDGLRYVRHTIFYMLADDFRMKERLMVITRNFDEGRIRRSLEAKKKKLQELKENSEKVLAAKKMLAMSGSSDAQEIELCERFLNRKFIYKERGAEKEFTFDIGIMTEHGEEYLYQMEMKIC